MLKHIPFYASLLGRPISNDKLATVSHVLVYGAIEAHSYGEKGCIASNETIAAETGLAVGTVKNVISELYKAVWLKVIYADETKQFRIVMEPLLTIEEPVKHKYRKSNDTPSSPNDGTVIPQLHPRHSPMTRDNILDNSIELSETKVSRDEIDTLEDDVSFEDDEEIVPTKTLRKKGVPKSLEPEIQKMWALWPGDHGQWKINKTIRSASEILLREKGVEKIANAVKFWLDNKNKPFCPDISTPYKLGERWDSLVAYRRKQKYGRQL